MMDALIQLLVLIVIKNSVDIKNVYFVGIFHTHYPIFNSY